MDDINTLVKGLKTLNLHLDESKEKEFIIYKSLLKEWNEKIDITTIIDNVEIDIKHFLDSLTPLTTGLFAGRKRLIDIGTGGGFPGLPLKIYNKELDVTLMDSLNKRIVFLDAVIESLALKGIKPIHGRAEELARKDEYREKYDICISRAVASLDTLAEYCLPFVKVGGHFISMKGPDYKDELNKASNSIKTLGGEIEKSYSIQLPETDIVHSIIIIKKTINTNKKYPRAGGKPRKSPL